MNRQIIDQSGPKGWLEAQIKAPLRKQLNLLPWRKYIDPLRVVSIEDGTVVLFHKKADEVRRIYGRMIQACVDGVTIEITDRDNEHTGK